MTGTKTTLTFNAKTHRYRLDGAPIRGVTGLISGGTNSDALVRWAGNSVADFIVDEAEEFERMRSILSRERLRWELRNIPESIRNKAGVKGTEVHAIAQRLLADEDLEVPERLWEYVEGYLAWVKKVGLRPLFTERPVANRQHWYAGTPDFSGWMDNKGADLWLIDYKTSRNVYGDTCMQTGAYASAEFYVDENGFEIAMPKFDRHGILHITPDGCDLYDMGSIDDAFTEFLGVAQTSKTAKRRKVLTETPMVL